MSNASEVITVTFGGKTFRCSRRTHAHLLWTQSELDRRHPGAWLRIIQGCYNTSVAASAGTHDKDAVLDGEVVGLSWREAERFLRECGWATWYRFPPTFSHHLHFISLGYTTPVGIFVPGQVDDYYRHALGLAGRHNSGSDPTWHPDDINSTIFDFALWERELEEAMGYREWEQSDKDALTGDVAAAVVDALGKVKMTAPNGKSKVALLKWLEAWRAGS